MCLELICISSFVNYLHMLFVLISTDVSREAIGKLSVCKGVWNIILHVLSNPVPRSTFFTFPIIFF